MPNADKPIKNSNEKHNKKIIGYYFVILSRLIWITVLTH